MAKMGMNDAEVKASIKRSQKKADSIKVDQRKALAMGNQGQKKEGKAIGLTKSDPIKR